jgi:hypothetical protein
VRSSPRRSSAASVAPAIAATLALLTAQSLTARPLGAQTPKVYTACYVAATGTVYRIDKPAGSAPGAPTACGTSRKGPDVEFFWTDGADAVRVSDVAGGDVSGPFGSVTVAKLLGRALATTAPTAGQVLQWDGTRWTPTTPAAGAGGDHGALQGLADDDHAQYLLAGTRHALSGFAVTGEKHAGTLAISGPGTRLLWYPAKAAFRAGEVGGTQWDAAQIGEASTALGAHTKASGAGSTALGYQTVASGGVSTALGANTTASGQSSTAMGEVTRASGASSTAMGHYTTADGERSTAMGAYAWARYPGSFVIGDNSTHTVVSADAANEFTARFAGGYRFRTNADGTTGCNLPAGSGVFACTSSRTLKTGFAPVEGEALLAKVRALPVMTWSYTSEDATVRHLGPFAEDFRAAFGLGTDDRSIGVLDAAGVGIAGVQALEARTTALRDENAALRARLERLEAALLRREAGPR